MDSLRLEHLEVQGVPGWTPARLRTIRQEILNVILTAQRLLHSRISSHQPFQDVANLYARSPMTIQRWVKPGNMPLNGALQIIETELKLRIPEPE